MTQADNGTNEQGKAAAAPPAEVLRVAPGPHLSDTTVTTRGMMLDVVIGLAPVMIAAVIVFRVYAVVQVAICVASCVGAEAAFSWMRGRRCRLGDLSAVVTGLILAFSIPAIAPWYLGVLGGVVAIGLGKMVFGGLGHNIFNPGMVGRAFVMMAFVSLMAAGGYVLDVPAGVPGAEGAVTIEAEGYQAASAPWGAQAITQPTPMTENYQNRAPSKGLLWRLFVGNTNGSLGETSALACIVGGLYLCWRRSASWEIPLSAIVVFLALAGLGALLEPDSSWTPLHHLFGGAFLLGAFFIITDPVSSPLTPLGKMIYGASFGALVMLLRAISSYPEGVMFSVLLVNALAPLINRWTVPRPVGGPAPQSAA